MDAVSCGRVGVSAYGRERGGFVSSKKCERWVRSPFACSCVVRLDREKGRRGCADCTGAAYGRVGVTAYGRGRGISAAKRRWLKNKHGEPLFGSLSCCTFFGC